MAVPAVTDNSPQLGDIAWAAFTIQYNGVGYQIGAGSTSQRWVWWRYSTNTIEAGPDLPADLTDDDLVLFGNKNGIAVRVQSSTTVDGELIVDGSILARAVSAEVLVANDVYSQTGYFGDIKAEQIKSGSIEAQIALLGMLGIGNITIAPAHGVPGDADYDPGGIVIPLSTGGTIQFPADGTPALIEAILRTKDLVVDGGLNLNGLANYVNGKLILGSGTPNPAQPTGLGYAFFTKTGGKLNVNSYDNSSRGLAKTTSGHYGTTIPWGQNKGQSGPSEFVILDPTTKNVVHTKTQAEMDLYARSVTAVGNVFYVLGIRWNPTAGEYQMRIQGYNTDGTSASGTHRWLNDNAGARLPDSPVGWAIAIASEGDGSHLRVARGQTNGKIVFYSYTLTSNDPTDSVATPDVGISYMSGAMYYGKADYGTTINDTMVVLGVGLGSAYRMAAFSVVTGAEVPANSFGTVAVDGIIYDGTKFITLDWDTTGAWLSNLNTLKTDTTVYAQHDWTNAAGTKRSKPSAVASRLIPKRTWPMITIPAPPKTGNAPDIADRVNVYLDTDSVTKLLTTETSGVTKTIIAAAMSGTGIAPKLATDVTDFANADATGALESVLGNISLKGDGAWKLGELIGLNDGSFSTTKVASSVVTTAPYTGRIDFVRLGQMVFAFGYLDRASGFNASNHDTTARIPNGFKPAADVVGNYYPNSGNTGTYRYRFNADGIVQLQQTVAIATFQSFSTMWLAA